MHATNGILFNHESPLRGETFVTRKITRAVAAIETGSQSTLYLGNLDAKRDWGHARDYVEGMWRIVQHETAEDWVLATGTTTSVRRFVELAFAEVGKALAWSGEGVDEKGHCAQSGKLLVAIDPRYFRPTEVDLLLGDPSKAKQKLGWEHSSTMEEIWSARWSPPISRRHGLADARAGRQAHLGCRPSRDGGCCPRPPAGKGWPCRPYCRSSGA